MVSESSWQHGGVSVDPPPLTKFDATNSKSVDNIRPTNLHLVGQISICWDKFVICPNKLTKSHPGQILSHAKRPNLSQQILSCPAFCWTKTKFVQRISSFCLFVLTNGFCSTKFVGHDMVLPMVVYHSSDSLRINSYDRNFLGKFVTNAHKRI